MPQAPALVFEFIGSILEAPDCAASQGDSPESVGPSLPVDSPLVEGYYPPMKRKKTDQDLFNQQLLQVHNDYIGPAIQEAIERANAVLKPPPSVVIHAIFAAAFNACTEAEPDERKAYTLFNETAASILDLHSIPSNLHRHS